MSDDGDLWKTAHGDTVEIYLGRQMSHGVFTTEFVGQVAWRYRIKAANNRIVEQSSEGYTRRPAAIKAALRHHPRLDEIEQARERLLP